jgi:hypothetical protein
LNELLAFVVLFSPHFLRIAVCEDSKGTEMKKAVAIAALGLSLISSAATAAERATDAALGAVSGAVVLGPIGAVAGAVVGYAAGPSIAHSWGLRGSRTAHQRTKPPQQEAPTSLSANQPTARDQASAPSPAAAPPPPKSANTSTANTTTSSAPPVQTLE